MSAVATCTSRPCAGLSHLATFATVIDRKSTRLNSSHLVISYAVFCLKKKNDDSTVVNELHGQSIFDYLYKCDQLLVAIPRGKTHSSSPPTCSDAALASPACG